MSKYLEFLKKLSFVSIVCAHNNEETNWDNWNKGTCKSRNAVRQSWILSKSFMSSMVIWVVSFYERDTKLGWFLAKNWKEIFLKSLLICTIIKKNVSWILIEMFITEKNGRSLRPSQVKYFQQKVILFAKWKLASKWCLLKFQNEQSWSLTIFNSRVMQFIYNKLTRCEIRRGAMWNR